MVQQSLYQRLGGVNAIAMVVDRFSDEIVENPKLQENPGSEGTERVGPATNAERAMDRSSGGSRRGRQESPVELHRRRKLPSELISLLGSGRPGWAGWPSRTGSATSGAAHDVNESANHDDDGDDDRNDRDGGSGYDHGASVSTVA